jgi:hypothetical protein
VSLAEPLSFYGGRATPLSFGLYVTPNPEENPIDPPERFEGFHAGTDYEVSTDELEEEVSVSAICTGEIAYSGFAEGYGGLVVQRCRIRGEDVSVIYGHLSLGNVPKQKSKVKAGARIGILADARTHESGENRKHLHLGIHRGEELDLRGYVQSEEELKEYIDPLTVLPQTSLSLYPGGVLTPYWQESANEDSASD